MRLRSLASQKRRAERKIRKRFRIVTMHKRSGEWEAWIEERLAHQDSGGGHYWGYCDSVPQHFWGSDECVVFKEANKWLHRTVVPLINREHDLLTRKTYKGAERPVCP